MNYLSHLEKVNLNLKRQEHFSCSNINYTNTLCAVKLKYDNLKKN